ncbi:hypothetical protein GCM10009745_46650 [Kribbella yunnanensis]|uniref:Uncharacterized protein n=1 Tax=Kribbella yunnanensis TaxID=190194 RepID=A0ABN2HYI1_9ACTN
MWPRSQGVSTAIRQGTCADCATGRRTIGGSKRRFEPAFACERGGSEPDGLYDEMERLGPDVDDTGGDDNIGPVQEAAYALMEHLTGVRLTAEHFAGSFVTGLVKLPG